MNIEGNRLIENYLHDNLSDDGKKDFLSRVDSDAGFKKKYLFEKQLFETLNKKEWNFSSGNLKDVKEYKELFESEDVKKLKTILNKISNKFQKSIKKNK